MRILFRVYRVYFELIRVGEKTVELRQRSPYWNAIARRAKDALARDEPVVGIFVCGRDRQDREVFSVLEDARAVEVLNRPLSARGVKDLGGEDPRVNAFYLRRPVDAELGKARMAEVCEVREVLPMGRDAPGGVRVHMLSSTWMAEAVTDGT